MIYQITYEGKGTNKHKVPSLVKDRQALMALRNAPENLKRLEKARNGNNRAKASLLQLAYNMGYVKKSLAGCKSQGSFFFHDIDCYNSEASKEQDPKSQGLSGNTASQGQSGSAESKEQRSASLKDLILSKKDEIGLMMLERSASGGWHLVCRRERGKTILESQVRVASILQIEMDTNAHDLPRVVYSTSGSPEDLVYLDDALFTEPMTPEECLAEYAALKQREKQGKEEVPPEAKKTNKHYLPSATYKMKSTEMAGRKKNAQSSKSKTTAASRTKTPKLKDDAALSTQPAGLESSAARNNGPSARSRFIFSECLKEAGLEQYHLIEKGGRHPALKAVLSTGITQLLSKAELLGVLSERMPDTWQDENIQQLVSDFYEKYTDSNRKMTLFERRLFAQSMKIGGEQEEAADDDADGDDVQEPQQGGPLDDITQMFASPLPPELPTLLPRLLALITCNTPQRYKAAVAQAVFPPLATYPQQLQFRYIDNNLRELRINCLIIAPTGAGKDTCTREPIKRITADMRARDDVNRDRLNKFNVEFNSKGANKQKPQRPTDIIIQYLMPDVTKAALVQRMTEANQAPLYVKLNELEQWDRIEGAVGRSNHFTTMKLVDDEDNDFGSERASTQSVSGAGKLHMNWNANTTIGKAIRYFRHVMTDGPISRLTLATIPMREIGTPAAVFDIYDNTYNQQLKPFIDNLKAATGTIDCPEAREMTQKLMYECCDFARQSQDTVFDNLSRRGLSAVFRKACLLYVANGMQWEPAIEQFCRWSLFYDLYLKMTVFGELIRHADDDIHVAKRGPRNLLELLPPEFTIDDARHVRQQQGMGTDRTTDMINNWKARKYVEKLAQGRYRKLKIEN